MFAHVPYQYRGSYLHPRGAAAVLDPHRKRDGFARRHSANALSPLVCKLLGDSLMFFPN